MEIRSIDSAWAHVLGCNQQLPFLSNAASGLMSMASLVAERFRYVLHEKLAPHTPEFGMAVGTILTYWAAALFYDLLDRLDAPWVRRYRVVRKQPGRANLVTKGQVVTRVLLQHAVQFILGFVLLLVDPDQCDAKQPGGWAISCLQFAAGTLIMDTWQFWIHRWMHVNPTLYKHIHSHHHRLLVPYAYGALYNHPLEGLMLDTVGGVLALYGSGMSCKVGVWCLNFATLKTVLDHCGYLFPINPLHDCFPNSTAYHDVHHDIRFIKKNYSQPFYVHWDWIMGSYKSTKDLHLLPGEEAAKAGAEGTGADSDGSEHEGPSATKAAQAESRKKR